jgi:hypothetical protein
MHSLINQFKLFLGIETYCQQYARLSGFEIKHMLSHDFNKTIELYCDDELVGQYSSELAASSEVYYLLNLYKEAFM